MNLKTNNTLRLKRWNYAKFLQSIFLSLLTVLFGFPSLWGAVSTNDAHKTSLSIKWSEEKTDKLHVVTILIKNTGTDNIVDSTMDLVLIGSKPNEIATGKIKLSLSKGQEVKLPVSLPDNDNKSDGSFFGINIPLSEHPIKKIQQVEISMGDLHFSSSSSEEKSNVGEKIEQKNPTPSSYSKQGIMGS
jgi:hypothetical protein